MCHPPPVPPEGGGRRQSLGRLFALLAQSRRGVKSTETIDRNNAENPPAR
jgi:hypothetical protein